MSPLAPNFKGVTQGVFPLRAKLRDEGGVRGAATMCLIQDLLLSNYLYSADLGVLDLGGKTNLDEAV